MKLIDLILMCLEIEAIKSSFLRFKELIGRRASRDITFFFPLSMKNHHHISSLNGCKKCASRSQIKLNYGNKLN